ncbi:MAG: hypothetical protein NT049_13800 [Planctomycetota bacterium]|nr:hypothetical protein [Planctomycetota bacterium]
MTKAAKESGDAPKAAKFSIWRLMKGVLVALGTAAVGCGVLYALDFFHDDIRVAPGYVMTSDSLRLVKYPRWMTPAILAELDVSLLDPAFPQRFSLLDADVCEKIAAAYEKCPWIEKVERIVKHDPRVDPKRPPLEVTLRFRRPLAFIQQRDGFVLMDEHCTRLPGVYSEPRLGAEKFLVVTGIAAAPPEAGQEWKDAAVQAALRVADAVEDRRETYKLATIDMSNFGHVRDPRDTEIAIWTASDTRIKWGRAPSREAVILQEKTPDEKVAYLDYVYKTQKGQVDGQLSYIDIPNEAIRRRTATTDVATTRVRS